VLGSAELLFWDGTCSHLAGKARTDGQVRH
jgi:hypothetical protein